MVVELGHPPLAETFEGLGVGDVVDQDDALGLAEVGREEDAGEALLAGGIPDLGLDLAVLGVQHLRVEFDAHRGRDVVIHGPVRVGQASYQRRFTNAGISQHDNFIERWLGPR